MKETMYNKIEFLIDQIEKDIRWHDSEIETVKGRVAKGAHIGASSALVQVVNRLYDILQK